MNLWDGDRDEVAQWIYVDGLSNKESGTPTSSNFLRPGSKQPVDCDVAPYSTLKAGSSGNRASPVCSAHETKRCDKRISLIGIVTAAGRGGGRLPLAGTFPSRTVHTACVGEP